MNKYSVVAIIFSVLLGVAIHAAIFRGSKCSESSLDSQARVEVLEKSNKALLHSIQMDQITIDSLEEAIEEKNTTIIKLNNDIRLSKKALSIEKQRIDKLSNHELTKEILDYYSN